MDISPLRGFSDGLLTQVGTDSWPKALSIFDRSNERLDHLGRIIITVELIQLREPEIVAGIIIVLWVVWIAAQITEVLHQHKRAVEFLGVQNRVLGYVAQRARPCGHVRRVGRGTKLSDGCIAIGR